MSRRTLRGAVPSSDDIVASATIGDGAAEAALAAMTGQAAGTRAAPGSGPGAGSSATVNTLREQVAAATIGAIVDSAPAVFRPPPVDGAPGPVAEPVPEPSVGNENILLRGVDAARARPLDLVTGAGRPGSGPGGGATATVDAVGPWAEELEQERELARTSGFQQGRQEGLAAGLIASRSQVEAHMAELADLVQDVLDGLTARAAETADELAAQVVDLAIDVAKAVIDREVATAEDPGADAIARCLDMVPDTGNLVVRLNPDDVTKLGQVPGLGDRELLVEADPTLASGDAVVGVDQVTVDARLSESLRRVEEVLR